VRRMDKEREKATRWRTKKERREGHGLPWSSETGVAY